MLGIKELKINDNFFQNQGVSKHAFVNKQYIFSCQIKTPVSR